MKQEIKQTLLDLIQPLENLINYLKQKYGKIQAEQADKKLSAMPEWSLADDQALLQALVGTRKRKTVRVYKSQKRTKS